MKHASKANPTHNPKPGYVRIIGGKWRSRHLNILPTATAIRPTPNRIRETLFNWLMPYLAQAYCLDAFAGCGALGFEALSRGAAHVVMTDVSRETIRALQTTAQQLQATAQCDIYQAIIPEQLKTPAHPFDIVFLDPPYPSQRDEPSLLLATCEALEKRQLLANTAYIYLESNQALSKTSWPPHWECIKQKKAGQVFYHLAYRGI